MCTCRPVQTAMVASLYQDFCAPPQVLAKDVMTPEDRASDTFALAVLQALRGALEAGSACSAQAAGSLLAHLSPSQRALSALRRLLQVCGRCLVMPSWLQGSTAMGTAVLTVKASAAHQYEPAVLRDFTRCSLPARHLVCRRRATICWTLSLRLALLTWSPSAETPTRQHLMTLVSPSLRQAGTPLWPACALLCVEGVA